MSASRTATILSSASSPSIIRSPPIVRVRNRLLGEDADVHRVAVAADVRDPASLRAALADAGAAVRLRNEAVERRRLAGIALRAIDAEVAALLVQLVFDGVGRVDLDVRLDHAGGISRRHPVPGVRLEHQSQELLQRVVHQSVRYHVEDAW